MREAVRAGLIGDVQSCHISIHWDHSWIAGTPFEAIDDLILYDFAIHWFDFLTSLIGDRATSVFATTSARRRPERPPADAGQALVAFDGGQAALHFDGAARFGAEDRTFVTGIGRDARQPRAGSRQPGGHADDRGRASRARSSRAPGSRKAFAARWARC